jgi:CRP-like cAMP-binding protein
MGDTTIDHLSRIPMFSGLRKKDLAEVSRIAMPMRAPAGRELTHEGTSGHQAFLVLDGSVTVKRNNRRIAQRGAGSLIGELSLLDGGMRTATVTCDTDCDLLVMSRPEFRAVVTSNSAVARTVLAELAGRVRELDRAYYG